MGTVARGVPKRVPRDKRGSGRESCLIRLFVKLTGQLVVPPGPRASRLSQWAPREPFSLSAGSCDYY